MICFLQFLTYRRISGYSTNAVTILPEEVLRQPEVHSNDPVLTILMPRNATSVVLRNPAAHVLKRTFFGAQNRLNPPVTKAEETECKLKFTFNYA